jgi:NTP pyrophosphatase (non-canonical NTP hydrolase)
LFDLNTIINYYLHKALGENMKTQAHELTDKQKEYLLILAEECSEVIKVITKTFRFGLDSKNPYIPDSPTNKEELIQEIGDVMAMVELLKDSALELTDY